MSTRKEPYYIHDPNKDKINISEFIPLHFEKKIGTIRTIDQSLFHSEENIAHRKKRELQIWK